MEAEKVLVKNVVQAALDQLKADNFWTDDIISRIEMLHTTNSLTDVAKVYEAFSEVSMAKAGGSND